MLGHLLLTLGDSLEFWTAASTEQVLTALVIQGENQGVEDLSATWFAKSIK